MKYSEYLQLRELLEQKPELNEGILGTIGAAAWNLAKKGMAKAVSAGLSDSYKEKLNKSAQKVKDWVVNDLNDATDKEEHALNKFLAASKSQTGKSKAKIDKYIAQYINKNVEIQSNKIKRSIDKASMLTDDDKENMKDYWEELLLQVQLSVAMSLQDKKIIGEDDADEFAKIFANLSKMGQTKEEPIKKQTKKEKV